MSSPTQRSMKYLRELGYTPWIVEQNIRIPGKGMFKRDLYNCIDIIGIRPGMPVLGIQCTSHSNLAARVKKCTELGQEWLATGCTQLQCWAWRKLNGKRELQLDKREITIQVEGL